MTDTCHQAKLCFGILPSLTWTVWAQTGKLGVWYATKVPAGRVLGSCSCRICVFHLQAPVSLMYDHPQLLQTCHTSFRSYSSKDPVSRTYLHISYILLFSSSKLLTKKIQHHMIKVWTVSVSSQCRSAQVWNVQLKLACFHSSLNFLCCCKWRLQGGCSQTSRVDVRIRNCE